MLNDFTHSKTQCSESLFVELEHIGAAQLPEAPVQEQAAQPHSFTLPGKILSLCAIFHGNFKENVRGPH